MTPLKLEIEAQPEGTRGRACRLTTAHAIIETPVFMPVGTHATVRGQRVERLEELGFPVLLANTYHLLLRPGPDLFRQLGNVHRFMGWSRSILTDSGGFQIFSLPNDRTLDENGATFTSYVDNRRVLLSPERSLEMQAALGSDIMMALDHCLPSTVPYATALDAVERTHRWAKRSLAARINSWQALFGIVQGACHPELRRLSADQLTSLPFDGFAVGGLAVGEPRSEREDMTALTTELLPTDRPRYLMGVGTPIDLLEGVHRGVDMFDCILPTALGARGLAFTWSGRIQLRRSIYARSEAPLDPDCPCTVCARYSRAYLRHLLEVPECLAAQLISEHNLTFYRELMRQMRTHLLAGTFESFYRRHREAIAGHDLEHPPVRPKPARRRRQSPSLGNFEVHELRPQLFSVRHLPSGEVMHSVNAPEEEARQLYLAQSRLTDRLEAPSDSPLVVWDVGLGAGVNAMTVVHALEAEREPPVRRPLHLVSFELDLDALRLAVKHASRFPHARHSAPSALLSHGSWQSSRTPLTWTLLEGDFLERLEEAPAPDVIFFDPFSTKTNGTLWTLSCFRRIAAKCAGLPTSLYTYSNATGVRSALLAAGFFVAKGVATGPKDETTIALAPHAADSMRASLLSREWLSRYERSHARYPKDIGPDDYAAFDESIRAHPQFALT